VVRNWSGHVSGADSACLLQNCWVSSWKIQNCYRSFDAQILAGTGIPELLEKTIGVLGIENNLA
jgi:hypothetical protein